MAKIRKKKSTNADLHRWNPAEGLPRSIADLGFGKPKTAKARAKWAAIHRSDVQKKRGIGAAAPAPARRRPAHSLPRFGPAAAAPVNPPTPPGIEILRHGDAQFEGLRKLAKAYVQLSLFPAQTTAIYVVNLEAAAAGQAALLKTMQTTKVGGKVAHFYDQASVDLLHRIQLPAIVFGVDGDGTAEPDFFLAAAEAPCRKDIFLALGSGNQAMVEMVESKGTARASCVLAGLMGVGGYRVVMGNGPTAAAGLTYAPYSKNCKVLGTENSFAAALAAAEARYLMQPLFGRSMDSLAEKLDSIGGTPTLEDTPFTTKAVSGRGFGSALHYDSADFGDYSCLAFYAVGPNPEALLGGTVYFPYLGLALQPGRCTAMILKTTEVLHGTTPSRAEGGDAEFFATALVANSKTARRGARELVERNGKLPKNLQLGQWRISVEAKRDRRVQAVLELLQKGSN